MLNTMKNALGGLGAVTVASVTIGALALAGASAAQAGTASVTNGGTFTASSPTIMLAVQGLQSRNCKGVPPSPSSGPQVSGALLNSSNVAWGTPLGSLSLRFYCPQMPGVSNDWLVDCTTSTANFAVTAATVSGVTPGVTSLQCNVSLAMSGYVFTTIGGTVPMSYKNAAGMNAARATIGVTGQTLSVTGASALGFQNGNAVTIGESTGLSLVNLNLLLIGNPVAHPILASS